MAMHANTFNALHLPTRRKKNAQSEIVHDMHPFLRTYKCGRVERLVPDAFVPASEDPGATGVSTRDVVIDPATGVSARLFLSVAAVATGRRLPLVVYFHGGAFCTGSAFSDPYHTYAASLAAHSRALVVSVEYRLAPEHPIPAAYEDSWVALRWVAARADPWLSYHADPTRLFLAGDSAGANIAHDMAVRVGVAGGGGEDGIHIEGMVILQPFFWGSERLPAETDRHNDRTVFSPEFVDTLWPFLTAGGSSSVNDDPRINPPADQVASVPCRRVMVGVAERDVVRDRGCRYAAALLRRLAGDGERRRREVTLVVSKGKDHGFHLYRPGCASAVDLMGRVSEFINGQAPTIPSSLSLIAVGEAEHLRAREREGTNKKTCVGAFGDGPDKKVCDSPVAGLMAWNVVVESPRGRPSSTGMVQMGPFAPAAVGINVVKSRL